MLALSEIREKIINIDYGLNKESLVLLVPVISFICRKIKTDNLLQQLRADYPIFRPGIWKDPKFEKLDSINKYHAIAGLIQCIALVTFSVYSSLLLVPAIFSFYETIVSSRALQHICSSEFTAQGNQLTVS